VEKYEGEGQREEVLLPAVDPPITPADNILSSPPPIHPTGYVSLHAGDVYYDVLSKRPGTLGKPAGFKGWVPSHPGKKSTGLGDYAGVLGGVIPHVDDVGAPSASTGTVKKGEVVFRQPNIKTNPPAKGGYGFVGTTLGERMGRQGKGVVGEYSYQPDAYSIHRKRDEVAAGLFKGPPFVPGNGMKRTGPGRTGRGEVPWMAEGNGKAGAGGRPASVPVGAFRPGGASQGALSRYPGYVENPPKEPAPEPPRPKPGRYGRWAPPAAPRVGPHPSIIAYNMKYAPSNVPTNGVV